MGLAWDPGSPRFLFSPRSQGGSAHRTPAHPQRLLHHQRAGQKRYATHRRRLRAPGARGGGPGLVTVVTCDLASAEWCPSPGLGGAVRVVARRLKQTVVVLPLRIVRFGGAWGTQAVERPTSAQVTVSQSVSSSPTSRSVPTGRSPEPAWDCVSPPLSAPAPLTRARSPFLSLSKINSSKRNLRLHCF